MCALDGAKIATDTSSSDMIASLIQAPNNAISFSNEDLPLEGRAHNRPLFIQATVKVKRTFCIMDFLYNGR